jgi:hypothetical protein
MPEPQTQGACTKSEATAPPFVESSRSTSAAISFAFGGRGSHHTNVECRQQKRKYQFYFAET